jgi:hypothetical protein
MLCRTASFCTLTLLCLNFSCKEDEPPKPATLSLRVEDASCTEAWLKATTTEVPATVRLLRDGQRTSDFRLLPAPTQSGTTDSLLLDEGLLPRRTYTYQLQKLNADSSVVETSASVQLTTLDTTSHNFTWQIDTLGTHSSVLYDVAIINDTLVYAVGEIFHRDSSENWTFFNLAKWNGRDWTLHRVYYRGNNIIHTRWILAFAWNDIWITPYTHWDGMTWREVPFDPIFSGVGTNKAWGTSSSDFYVVGNGGFIAHYDGVQWRRVESGTNADLRDVYGNVRSQNVWAVGYLTDFSNSSLLEYNGQMWRTVRRQSNASPRYADSLSGIMTSVWAFSERHIDVASSAGMYRIQGGSRGEAKRTWLPAPFSVGLFTRVRGDERNNVFVVAPFGTVAHYNGVSWKQYQEFFNVSGHPNLLSISVNENTVMAVGYSGVKAIVIKGRKQ